MMPDTLLARTLYQQVLTIQLAGRNLVCRLAGGKAHELTLVIDEPER